LTEIQAIELACEIRQVKSMVDHSVNVTLNIPEYCRDQAAVLLAWQGLMAKVVMEVINDKELEQPEGAVARFRKHPLYAKHKL